MTVRPSHGRINRLINRQSFGEPQVARSCETATQNVSRRDRQTGARDGCVSDKLRLDSLIACHPYQKIYLSANCITRFPLLLVTKPKLALVGLEFAPFQLG